MMTSLLYHIICSNDHCGFIGVRHIASPWKKESGETYISICSGKKIIAECADTIVKNWLSRLRCM